MSRHPRIAALGLAAALGLGACSASEPADTVAPSGPPAAATDAPASEAASQPPAATAPPAAAGPCAPSTDAGTVAVRIEGFAFSPSTVAASVGDVIEFTNADSAPHTATLDDQGCSTEGLGRDEAGALVFTEAGTYPFHCQIHPDMRGTFEISG